MDDPAAWQDSIMVGAARQEFIETVLADE